ncbi:SH3 domain-containing protein, partial [Campylobacter rectus]
LKQNINVKILPTQNSSVFYTSKAQQKVEILGEREDYVKILLDDGKIGWVKKDDIF